MSDLLHALRELDYGDLGVRTDVEDLAHGVRVIHQLDQRTDDVAHVSKTTALVAVAVNRDRPACDGLFHKRRNYHAVLARLPGTDGIEESHDNRGQFLLAPVSKCQKLVNGLRAGIAPAALRSSAHHEIAVFAKRHVGTETVNFGSGRDQNFLLLFVGQRKNDFSAVNVRFDRPHGALDDQLDADGGRHVKDNVALIDQLGSNRLVVDGVNRVMKPRMTFEMLNVLDRAGG